MNENLLIEAKEIGDHRISIYYDTDRACPVKEWDMGGCYIFEYLSHGRYHLSPDCDWKEYSGGHSLNDNSCSDLLQRMASDVVSQKDIIDYIKSGNVKDQRLIYDLHTRMWDLQYLPSWKRDGAEWTTGYEFEPYDLKECDYRMELLEDFEEEELMALIQKYAKDMVIMEFSSTGYSQGDHLRGYGYMTKERFDKMVGFNPNKYKDWKEQAMVIMEGETKEIGMWAWGDVKGYVLEKKVPFTKTYADGTVEEDFEWEEIFSCWGFYMETEELIAEVISEYDLKESA